MIHIDEPAVPARMVHDLRDEVDRRATGFQRKRRMRIGMFTGAATATAAALFVVAVTGPVANVRTEQTAGLAASGGEDDSSEPNGLEEAASGSTSGDIVGNPPRPPQTIPPGVLPPSSRSSFPVLTDQAVIAFRTGTSLTMMSVDGTGRRNIGANGTSPTWAPHGKQLAYVNEDRDLEEYDVATNTRRILVHRDGYQISEPSWSPDGSFIVFALHPALGSLALDMSKTGLWLLDTRTGQTRHVRLGDSPSIRRDGTIVYSCNGRLCLTDTTGADRGVIPGTDAHRLPAWSPDGNSIAALADNKVVVFGADGSGRRVVTERVAWKPAWLPDGSRIAFVPHSTAETDCNTAPCDGIWAVRLDGSDPRPIAGGMALFDPALVRAP